MNKTITTAYEAVKNNPTNENIKALADLAVPKFKDYYERIAKAVRTINRHIGTNKGNPNRATIATAIGLKNEFKFARDIADVIKLQEIADAADLALNTIATIEGMRNNRTYAHIDVLPNFITNDEKAVIDAENAKMYLYNITNAVRDAIDTINRHIVDGTFDVNTYKIAKVRGYVAEIAPLCADLTAANANAVTADIVTTADIDAVRAIAMAIDEIDRSEAQGYRLGVPTLAEYNPFPNNGEGSDADEKLNETEGE